MPLNNQVKNAVFERLTAVRRCGTSHMGYDSWEGRHDLSLKRSQGGRIKNTGLRPVFGFSVTSSMV